MGKFAVVLGDPTSHGGKVITVSSTFELSGKNAALLNDTVTCPEHGINKIIECDISAYEENGRGIVLHGCRTQCGASVIASMQDMEVG
ncbi:PAAR domain-containing protein [Pluralibacter gergoviae]|uniref:PAAR domain-containing protein n=1 Tax=Pluralibacter gergoviae TaxID=61647 RepID=A0AAI9GJP9_PLUGE|nr:PAAR domain-containing protein [Pluralibacter gergoviae]EKV0915413.1 PAAR domain-containing protein [Pluralibacter gergoviae]EKV9908478.1 PAAR domain-containing protein [Pluralibacter gergoviae]EKW7273530.1 PAAR domain-containing protein [Pluralibacter gergoviae]ELD4294917.1 PAAR domain-containing protein [Pluralibacter gergoviae]ELD4307704.1 PAAR domain-containing protein [Pluralibacter gergoviae]